ncbi:MAG: class I SAM-dependent methyltransferase [Chloroflexota bacterium]
MKNRADKVWQSAPLVRQYLDSVRGAIPLAAEQLEVMLRLIAARSQPVVNFLDLGCGDGMLAGAILARYPNARGVLLDFSRPMLDAAGEKLSRFAAQLELVTADLADPGWPDAVGSATPFEVVVSGYAIHHQPDERKRALYAEIYHLLTPGGLFVNIERVASSTPWLEWVWDEYFIDTLHARQLEPNRTQVAETYHRRPDREANMLAPVETQCDWLRQIGYGDVDCYFKVFELAVFGGRRPAS